MITDTLASMKNKPLPALPTVGKSPTTKQAPVEYCIEEQKPTTYVTANAPPAESHSNSSNTVFSLQTSGSYETQIPITKDISPQDLREDSPRIGTYPSRRPGASAKNSATLYASNSNASPGSPSTQRLSPQVSATRPRSSSHSSWWGSSKQTLRPCKHQQNLGELSSTWQGCAVP